ncbi:MAG: hypothetical protein ACXQT6_02550 [Candidatus Methanospirareceae archaeon]
MARRTVAGLGRRFSGLMIWQFGGLGVWWFGGLVFWSMFGREAEGKEGKK